jgi:hypothetical protein
MIALFKSLLARITRRRRPQRGIRTVVAVRDGKWDDPATWRFEGVDTTGQFADGSIVTGKSYAGSASAKYGRPAAINHNPNG